MAFAVTADLARFDEAADYFARLVVLTRAEARRLGDEAGQRAFWIGGGLQIDQIQRVHDSLNRAIADGIPFDEWRKSVKAELRNDPHTETVFRNATQRSLNAGRWRQMREPGVLALRPYGLFDGIHDSRQSAICRECDGTVLPLDHPWWATHSPLLHHRCRSSIRNLRVSEAQRRGITNVPTTIGADDGFGLSPDAEPVWKPDPAKHEPGLVAEIERKKAAGRKAPAKPKTPPPVHDPKYWEAKYDKRYGDAAPAVAWGRAMLERGLDRSGLDVADELERLRLAGHPTLQGEGGLSSIRQLRNHGNKRLRGTWTGQDRKHLIALAEHTRTIEPGDALTMRGPLALPGSTRAFYDLGLDKVVKRPNGWTVERLQRTDPRRSHADDEARAVRFHFGAPERTYVHEVAHAIEFEDARALQRSLAFVRARTKGEKLQSLRDLTEIQAYQADEFTRPDKFIDAYVGKDYGNVATEVTSMGHEALSLEAEHPRLQQLVKDDFEHVLFLLGQLAGR
jgi:SPP1 gp7 family putative phage head morphogenesis protein